MLRTNYKPCNGIQIFFDRCENYLKSGVYTDSIPNLCIEPHEIYPNKFCIQLRGDTADVLIVIAPFPGVYGRHVSKLGERYVDLDDLKTQVYINNVLNSLP